MQFLGVRRRHAPEILNKRTATADLRRATEGISTGPLRARSDRRTPLGARRRRAPRTDGRGKRGASFGRRREREQRHRAERLDGGQRHGGGRSADFFYFLLATFSVHADGGTLGATRSNRRVASERCRSGAPLRSLQTDHGSSAFAAGMLRDIEKTNALGRR